MGHPSLQAAPQELPAQNVQEIFSARGSCRGREDGAAEASHERGCTRHERGNPEPESSRLQGMAITGEALKLIKLLFKFFHRYKVVSRSEKHYLSYLNNITGWLTSLIFVKFVHTSNFVLVVIKICCLDDSL